MALHGYGIVVGLRLKRMTRVSAISTLGRCGIYQSLKNLGPAAQLVRLGYSRHFSATSGGDRYW